MEGLQITVDSVVASRLKTVCMHCGKPSFKKYCSDRCRKDSYNARKRERRKYEKDDTYETIEEINEFRKYFGLKEIERGTIKCLGCGRMFHSEDKMRNRMCQICHKRAERRDSVEVGRCLI